MPQIQIQMTMETVQRALCSVAPIPTPGTAIAPAVFIDKNSATGTQGGALLDYKIQNVKVFYTQIDVDPRYADSLVAEIRAKQDAKPLRIDYASWSSFKQQIPVGTSGPWQQDFTSQASAVRKLLFGLVSLAESSTAANTIISKDCLNAFYWNGLSTYQFLIDGSYYPALPVGVQQGVNFQNATEYNCDLAAGYYYNALAMGTWNNPMADMSMTWSPTSVYNSKLNSGGVNTDAILSTLTIPNFVYCISTMFDDLSLPTPTNMMQAGQIALNLDFSGNPVGATGGFYVPNTQTQQPGYLGFGLVAYIFIEQTRSIKIYDGMRCDVVIY